MCCNLVIISYVILLLFQEGFKLTQTRNERMIKQYGAVSWLDYEGTQYRGNVVYCIVSVCFHAGLFLESLDSPLGAFYQSVTLGDNRTTIEYVQSAKGGVPFENIACVYIHRV